MSVPLAVSIVHVSMTCGRCVNRCGIGLAVTCGHFGGSLFRNLRPAEIYI